MPCRICLLKNDKTNINDANEMELTERVVPEQRLCVLPHGAVVLLVKWVKRAGESPRRGVRRRQRSVVRQRRVDRRGFIDRGSVRRDQTFEGRVGRRESRCGDDRSGAGR